VLNVVTGDGRTGAALVAHDGVDKIAFTGSTDVGRVIRRETAGSGKKLSLELGGKSPFIVFEDADLDSVVEGVVDAIWFNQGEVCCAGSRLLVQEGVHDRLVDKLKRRAEKLRLGRPLDKTVDMGAVVAPVQLERIAALVEQGRAEGAEVWQPEGACPTVGSFYPPTVVTGVSPSRTIAQVEIFGPVLVAMTFRTPAEAVALANNTPYGLAASVWTDNINLAPRRRAEAQVRRRLGQRDQPVRRGGGLRRVPRERLRARGRAGGDVRVPAPGAPRPSRDAAAGDGEGDSRLATGGSRPDARSSGSRDERADAHESRVASRERCPRSTARPSSTSAASRRAPTRVHPAGRRGGRARVGRGRRGNRKDVRNAVEAAHKAAGWARQTGHARAQVLYYVAENLAARAAEFAARLTR
jgi:aldehyde dehydrogenase (NAD+)